MRRLALFFLSIQLLVIGLSWRKLPPELPLFYSRPWGKEQITTPKGLLFLPIISLATIVLNSLLLPFIAKDKLITKILIATTVLISLFGLITLVKIIMLV